VLDDIHSCTSEVLELLLNFLCDPIMERLPPHIRFLVLSRPSEEVNRRIGKVGFEIPPSTTAAATTHAEESNFFDFGTCRTTRVYFTREFRWTYY